MAATTDWRSLSKPNSEWEKWVESIGGQAPDIGMFPDISAIRQWIIASKSAMSAQMGGAIQGVTEIDHQVSMRDGARITVRTYQPDKPPAGGSPLGVIYHGGGWCVGGLENEELLCRLLAEKLGVVCVNVDYRLAPEHKFPTAVNDCFDATKWAAENAASLKADPSKGFIIGGTSAGGQMTAVISHLWRDEGLKPALTGAHLMIPSVCWHAWMPKKYNVDSHSWEQNKDAPILGQKACHLFLDNYIPKEEDRKDPKCSPLLFPTGQKGLPPSYFQVCGMDPLRDEALIFERILREDHSVPTKLDVYAGLPHGYWSAAPQLEASKTFVAESVQGWEWLLQQK